MSRDPVIALAQLRELQRHATAEIMRWQQVIELTRGESTRLWQEIRALEQKQRNAQVS